MVRKQILFLTRNGLLEPLGQSQILAYLVPLSKEFDFHIVSFEKSDDFSDRQAVQSLRNQCQQHGIQWTPLTYRRFSRQLGILLGFVELIGAIWRICNRDKVDCIHARSYYPAFIALLFNGLRGIPFIFDMRALWPEELVVAGRLRAGSLTYKLIKQLESRCLKRAAAVVSLTEAAATYLNKKHPANKLANKMFVIPTCTDIERFEVIGNSERGGNRWIISCIGTLLSGWFKLDLLRTSVQFILQEYPQVDFEILTRDDPQKVQESLDPSKKWEARLQISSVPFTEMPKRLRRHKGSIFFFNADISKLGSCPTRMGELLAAGIPILANPGVGDVETIIQEHQVGVLIEDESEAAVHGACQAFIQLLQRSDIAEHCRNTAIALFSLEGGVSTYRQVYQQALSMKTSKEVHEQEKI